MSGRKEMNPYITQQAQQLQTNATNNLQRNIMPGINSGAIAAGGFGGSRQGIAQGLAIGETNRGVADAQANLYANAYNMDQQFGLGNRAADTAQFNAQTSRDLGFGNLDLNRSQVSNNYNLGMGQLGLGALNANQNFYTAQRGQDLQSLGLGAQLANNANTGLANQGQQLYNIGQQQQQAPWMQLQNYVNSLAPFTGLNQSNTSSTPGGSTLGGIAGGALTAAQLWKLLSGG